MIFTGSDGVCALAFSLAYLQWSGDYWVTLPCDREWADLNFILCQYTLHTLQG